MHPNILLLPTRRVTAPAISDALLATLIGTWLALAFLAFVIAFGG